MLDDLGSKLTEAITEAAAKSIPRIKPGLRSKPWWNDDLKQLRQDMNRKQRQFAKESKRCSPEDCLPWKAEYLNARNTYFSKIKSAKRDHWNTFLEKEDPRSIFKAMAYTQSTTSQRMPSIQSAQSLEDTFDGKCSALRSALFPKPPETSLPDWDTYSPREQAWEWPPLSKIELREACSSKVKSKTPGPDNITQDIIIAAYRANDELFFRIFSLFFNYGYHPRCWKQATGVIIKKKGKPDYSAPKAYRVISLLNCLGKVLERILAKRLGALAEVTHLLHPTQIGGRSRKSAIDAGLLLLDNVQEQRRLGRQTSTVFLDIKGAFDHVAQNQLLSVMRKLNLPLSLISWTRSFLTERLLRLTFDGQAQDFSPIQSGIPQGSPISPILFLIYIRDLFQISHNFSLSYMDDISISTSSTSLSKNMRVLSREVDALFRKGNELAIQFDPAKTELIHFTTGAAAPSTSLTLPDHTVVKPKKVVRWLGILFDDALSFKQHVSFRAGQATSAFFRMCRLANSERGLSAFAMRQLYMACVVSVADYGSPIYWKDQVFIESKLQSLQNLALRKILGTFRTSPVKPSEVEAALPPPSIRLNTNMRKYAFRARKLPPQHPIHARLTRIWNPGGADYDSDDSQSSEKTAVKGPFSQMQRIGWSISEFLFDDEKIVHNCFRPWQREAPFDTFISALSKDEEAQVHSATMLSSLGTNLLAIYSDASSVPKGNGIGVAFTVRDCSMEGKETHFDTTNIGNQQIVYNGELEGIARAFEYAAEVATTGQQIHVYADNQAAIHRIKNPSDNPGQAWQLRCFHAAAEVASKQASISLHWAPGHEGVDGNERADSLAKGAALARPNSRSTSLAMTGIRIKNRTEMEWRLAFSRYSKSAIEQNPSTYAKVFKWKFRKRLAIPPGTKRELTSTFYQLKLGHCYAKAYLARFGKADSDRCSCGAVQTREHLLLSCKWYRLERRELQNDIGEKELTLRLLLQTKKGIAATLCFLEKTKIATRKWQLGQNDDS
jgi:ribonuclease HI